MRRDGFAVSRDGFDEMLEVRQRIRTLIVHVDPEQASWLERQAPSFSASEQLRRSEKLPPDRPLALALLGIHDLIEAAIAGHIAAAYSREAEAESSTADGEGGQ